MALLGIETSLTNASGGSLANGAPVLFNNIVLNNSVGGSYAPATGTFTLTEPGTYLINWWVALDDTAPSATTPTSVSLTVNGTAARSAYAGAGAGEINGSSLITVAGSPLSVRLVNSSGGTIYYAPTSVQAGATVTQVA